jgi:hypothetical protein
MRLHCVDVGDLVEDAPVVSVDSPLDQPPDSGTVLSQSAYDHRAALPSAQQVYAGKHLWRAPVQE